MGGICAVKGAGAEPLVTQISDALRHRGPDDYGVFIADDLALGHRALHFSYLPNAHQPLSNEDHTVWITCDGEIYNKDILITHLRKTHVFQSDASAEVIIHAYEEAGVKCLSQFNGMFAFCLWDDRKRMLLAARDRFGIKPLYYHRGKERIVLASEIKGILVDPAISRHPNNQMIYDYLVGRYAKTAAETFFVDIHELSPAHYLTINNDKCTIARYWQLPVIIPKSSTEPDDEAYANRYYDLLRAAIQRRLPQQGSVGTFVSGGLDSTTLAMVIDEILRAETRDNRSTQELFSAIYQEPIEQDERPFIQTVEEALGQQSNYVFPSLAEAWPALTRFVSAIEEPVAVFNYYVFWCLYDAARQKVNLCFTGQGCDAALGGQSSHVMIYLKELWRHKKLGTLLNEVVKSADWFLPWLAYTLVFHRRRLVKMHQLLHPTFLAQYQHDEDPETASLQDAINQDITTHALEYLRVDDRAAAAFAVECRHPFLDHTLVEYCYTLPHTQRIRDGWTKTILRNAMKARIPETIRTKRKKYGTPIPHRVWFTALRHDITTLFTNERFKQRGIFNPSIILDVLQRFCDGTLNRLDHEHYQSILWRILNLELWFQQFIDPQAS